MNEVGLLPNKTHKLLYMSLNFEVSDSLVISFKWYKDNQGDMITMCGTLLWWRDFGNSQENREVCGSWNVPCSILLFLEFDLL